MRILATICLALALTGCAEDMEWFPAGGGVYGRSVEARDDAKCREFGFQPRIEAYGNCRLQLEQIRAIERAGVQTRRSAAQPTQGLSFMCKDAISRGDSGAMSIFC